MSCIFSSELPEASGSGASVSGIDCVLCLVFSAQNCQKLQVLELDHMCEVTEDVATEMCREGLKGLQALDFTFTPVTPKALMQFYSKYHGLTLMLVANYTK